MTNAEACRRWTQRNKDAARLSNMRWRKAHPEKVAEYAQAYRERHRGRIRNASKIWKEKNPAKVAEYGRIYRERHAAKIREKNRRWLRAGGPAVLDYRLAKRLRQRIRNAIHRDGGTGATLNLLGCTIGELRVHLEALFQKGMSWDNYRDWHIDHIKPCASFDLSDPR